MDTTPVFPERAMSHSKRAHEQLARKRSLQNLPSGLHSRGSSREHRSSTDIIKGSIDLSHPFGKELEQLNEVVEEFGGVIRDAAMEADMSKMKRMGLAKFCAADYMMEIQPLFSACFVEGSKLSATAGWI